MQTKRIDMTKWQVRRPVLSSTTWASNAHMVRDVARLGYLRKYWRTLDPTYGLGNWWKLWAPNELVKHDLYKLDGVDFRDLPEPDDSFEAVAYDPPYVCVGGRKTTTIEGLHDAYGLTNAPRSPFELQLMINDGLDEMKRVCSGIILVKCQPYISSGKLWNGVYETQRHAIEKLRLTQVDQLDYIVKTSRPQPKRRNKAGRVAPQVHARRNASTLLVFKV